MNQIEELKHILRSEVHKTVERYAKNMLEKVVGIIDKAIVECDYEKRLALAVAEVTEKYRRDVQSQVINELEGAAPAFAFGSDLFCRVDQAVLNEAHRAGIHLKG